MWCFACNAKCHLFTRIATRSIRLVSHRNHSICILWIQLTQNGSKHFGLFTVSRKFSHFFEFFSCSNDLNQINLFVHFHRSNQFNAIKIYLHSYTTFIVLYPTGVTGELLCLYWAQSYAQKNKIWSIELPNSANFTFSYYYFLWIVMLLYIPLFPQLYLHMFALRKKVLGKPNVGPAQSSKVKSK